MLNARATSSRRDHSSESHEQALQRLPLKLSDLLPAKEIAIQFSDLKLLSPGTQRDVLELTELSDGNLATLEAWWKRESGPDGAGSYDDFKAWMWKGSQANEKCLVCKMTSKHASEWDKNGKNFACVACANPRNRRSCIRLLSDTIDGEEKRQLVVLPKSIAEPWGYWGMPATPAPQSRR